MLGGRIAEGSDLKTEGGDHARVGSLFKVQGEKTTKVGEARDGDVVAVAKIDTVKAGQWLSAGKLPPPIEIDYPARNCAFAIEPADRKDDVKLSGALQRLGEEDAALIVEHDEANHEIRLRGVNDEHLNTVHRAPQTPLRGRGEKPHADGRLPRIDPQTGHPEGPPQEAVRRPRPVRRRDHRGEASAPRFRASSSRKRSTAARSRSNGSRRSRTASAKRCVKGPLGFEVVDCAVTLIDGSYHSVDSSELAFRLAGRIAMQDALAAAQPHLLEPMHKLTVVCPSNATSRITSAVAGRRGQMLGMGPRDGWTGWDRIDALIPEAELSGLEAELRSQSQGLATYEAEFDHLAELNGPLADKVIQQKVPEPA